MKVDIKKLISILFNLIIFLSTLVFTIIGIIFGAGAGQMGNGIIGIGFFKPYTMDSNIFMGIVSLIYLIFLFREMLHKKQIPHWVNVLYFTGTVTIVLTFLTVAFFLIPTNYSTLGILAFFYGNMFFFHLLNPILAVVCFILQKNEQKFGVRENFISIIPMVIYSIVYLIMVAFVHVWEDFYSFTFGGKYYIVPFVMLVMYGVVLLIGFVLIKTKKIK